MTQTISPGDAITVYIERGTPGPAGAPGTGGGGSDATKVLKTGDTMTGPLQFTDPQTGPDNPLINVNSGLAAVSQAGVGTFAKVATPELDGAQVGGVGNFLLALAADVVTIGRATKTWVVNALGQLVSVLADGTAPMIVASKTMVVNLNVEFLGGKRAAEFDAAGAATAAQAAAIAASDPAGAAAAVAANVYTKAASDAKYDAAGLAAAALAASDPAGSAATVAALVYTKTQSDARYYDKTTADGKYDVAGAATAAAAASDPVGTAAAVAANAYTKAAADLRFLNLAGGTLTGDLVEARAPIGSTTRLVMVADLNLVETASTSRYALDPGNSTFAVNLPPNTPTALKVGRRYDLSHFGIGTGFVQVKDALGADVVWLGSRSKAGIIWTGTEWVASYQPQVFAASVAVTPTTVNLLIGFSSQLTIAALDVNGVKLIGRTVTWASSVSAVATVSSTGLVTGVATGTTNVQATAPTIFGVAVVSNLVPVTITPVLTSIVTAPTGTATMTGTTLAFSAAGFDQSANFMPSVTTFTWASTSTSIATINSSGLATGVSAGTTNITAASGAVTSPAVVLTVAQTPTTVTMSPAGPVNIATQGGTSQITPTLRDQFVHAIVGATFTWATNDTVRTLVSSSGLVTAIATGANATITATSVGSGIIGSVTITTPATVPVLGLTPSTLALHDYHPVAIVPSITDQWSITLTGSIPVTWSSNHSTWVSVDSSGNVTGILGGHSVTITASIFSGGTTQTATVTTDAPAATSVVPFPTSIVGLADGGTVQIVPVTLDQFLQVFSDTLVPTTLTLAPANPTIVGVGSTITEVPTVKDQVGTVMGGQTVTFGSSNTGKFTVDSGGICTAVAGGSATLTATDGFAVGTTTINISIVTSLALAPSTMSLNAVGATGTLTPTVKDQNNVVLVGQTVTYGSSATGVATVASTGVVTEVAAGTATITGTCATITGTSAITCAIGGPSTALTANQPGGFVQLAYRPCATVTDGWHDNCSTFGLCANQSIITDLTAPEGPNVLSVNFNGIAGGDTPISQDKSFAGGTYKTLYFGFYIWFSNAFVHNVSGVQKLFYADDDSGSGGSEVPAFYWSAQSGGSLGNSPQIRTQTGEGVFFNIGPNIAGHTNDSFASDGSWHLIHGMIHQNTPNTSDGYVKMWIDNVQCTADLARNFHSTSATQHFFTSFRLQPYWGGLNGVSPAQTMRLGPMYFSGSTV